MRYIISIIIFFTSLETFAQESDTVDFKPDYAPTGLRIGVDALALGYTFTRDDINSYLITADMDFHRFFLVGEVGRYDRSRNGENGNYQTQGTYWRLGADINLLQKDPDQSVLFFGARYGKSHFSDELETVTSHPVYGTRTLNFKNDNLSADWFELIAGLKVPVWKLWMGYSFRLKFGMDDFEGFEFRPYEVPGYGLAAEKDYWEANYYLMYRIQWKDKKTPPSSAD